MKNCQPVWQEMVNILKARYGLSINKNNPYRVLISTLLSHRTKDELTDKVTDLLFSKYSTPREFSSLPVKKIESLIRGIGFYRTKARWIKKDSRILIDKFNSKVPGNFDDLISLPGVGRKTANCVLTYGFGIPALAVDTHVHRISNRLGLVKTKNPEDTEKQLTAIIPKQYWGWLNHTMVSFGKEICKPIGPKCKKCELSNKCKYHRNEC